MLIVLRSFQDNIASQRVLAFNASFAVLIPFSLTDIQKTWYYQWITKGALVDKSQ